MKWLRNRAIVGAFLLSLILSIQAWGRARAGVQSQDPETQAEALLALSARQNLDNHTVALQTAQQALRLWQELAKTDGIARAYAQIARCYYARSDLPEAIQNYEKALQLWRDRNDSRQQAAILIMLAFIENRKGDWSNSIAFYLQAQSLIENETDPQKRGQIANGFGEIFTANGLPENGLRYYQQALDEFRQTSDAGDDTMSIWAIGSTHYLLGDYPEALRYLQQALAGVAPDSLYAALCSEYLGRVYYSLGEYPTALQYLQAALIIYMRADNPMEAARVRALTGQVYEQQGRLKQAKAEYQSALKTFRALTDRVNQSATLFAMGSLELQQGNLILAQDYLRQSIEVTENLRRVSGSRDLTAAFSATVHGRYEKYIECLMRQYEAHPSQALLARAFEISDISRARSLAELLQATQTNLISGLDPQLAEQERALRQALKVKEDYKIALLGKAHQKKKMIVLEADLSGLQAEYKRVSEIIEARYPAYKEITRPAPWNLQSIQEQVIADDQTLLLEYSLGSEKSYVWAVTRDGIKSYDLSAQARIREAAEKAYRLLAAPAPSHPANEITLAVEELSRLVLSPVAAELADKRRIIIVADGILHYIPFQILLNPNADKEPLVAAYEISNTPSASILGELRKEAGRQQPTKILAAFGDPEFGSGDAQEKQKAESESAVAAQPMEEARLQQALRDLELDGEAFDASAIQPLFHARGELAALREAASGGETFVASGEAATREQLLSMDLTQYAILHFATHGLLDPKRPENSGLLLSTSKGQNGFVALQDIYGLRAPVDLVVLSACQTALGKDVRGEGLLGLARGFMYAGASSVVASLWKVNDEATAELMRQFYLNMLQKGMTPAAALRAAQNRIRQRPEWQMPYYWAGFTLQGEYRQVIEPLSVTPVRQKYWSIAIAGGALMLLAGGALWWRQRRVNRSRAKALIRR